MFAKRLKELRIESNLTQQELGNVLDINRTTIAGYENSNKEPPYQTLVQIAKFFNVTTDYLLGANNNRKIEDVNIGERLGFCDEAIGFFTILTKNAKDGAWNKAMLDVFNSFFIQGNYELFLDSILQLKDMKNMLLDELSDENTTEINLRMQYNFDRLELKTYNLQMVITDYIEKLIGINEVWEHYNDLPHQLPFNNEFEQFCKSLEDLRHNMFVTRYLENEGGEDNANDTEAE